MRPHPEGVLPVGNAYLLPPEEAAASARAKRDGLGSFAALDDALIIRLLSGGDDDDGVGPDALASLAACSRAMRAFAYHEDLWKAATLIAKGGDFRFTGGTWRDTYRYTRGGGGGDPGSSDDKAKVDAPKSPPPVFSDALYFRHLGAHLPLDPEWLERDTRTARGRVRHDATSIHPRLRVHQPPGGGHGSVRGLAVDTWRVETRRAPGEPRGHKVHRGRVRDVTD
jgi:hypothetical protein